MPDQIKVKRIDNPTGELFIVNAARVSYDKQSQELNSEDKKVLGNLIKWNHKTPISHARHVFDMRDVLVHVIEEMNMALMADPFLSSGVILTDHYMNLSVMNMIQIIKCDSLSHVVDCFKESFTYFLKENYPVLYKDCFIENKYDAIEHFEEVKDTSKLPSWFQNYSFYCEVPLWLAAQLKKHQVGLRWNEKSRRYCSNELKFFEPTYRMKDGSLPVDTLEDTSFWDSVIRDINSLLKQWYKKSIEWGFASETLRGNLPQNLMTTFIWSGPRAAFEHMIDLREDSHAQLEAQVFARKLKHEMNKEN